MKLNRDLLDISDGLLSGRLSVDDHHPVSIGAQSQGLDLGDGLLFIESFANVTALHEDGELALVDAGGVIHARQIHEIVRTHTSAPLRRAVYTHGHIDHCFGVPLFEAEDGAPGVEVISHEAVAKRFDRYQLTNGYNGTINQRQFRLAAALFPSDFRYPDTTFRESTAFSLGATDLELNHDKGETDDHTWVWMPQRRVLCTGDLIMWVAPNCGNPQKVQRYPLEWAAALRKMAELEPEILLPGHGLPIVGTESVATVLGDTAELLESITSQTLEMMNAGETLDSIIHSVEVPGGLLDRPWMQPIYDDPEFIVHNVWRLYGGWFDGNPARLKPAPESALAAELASLCGGSPRLAERALELAGDGELRLAGHLAELAAQADPDGPEVHAARAEVNRARVAAETSLMAKGIFGWAEHVSTGIASRDDGPDGGDRR
ncbi:MAG: MBL fold metallo-hydrolase [Microthrixaceae bacterium]|nr:MBL fold metallo-hydrolase [Microthrixaceae bacterium]MCB1010831.1 MBL fold metallo-hydrolase [Microthrixaceae bacterium]